VDRKRVYMKLDGQVTVSSTGQLSTLRNKVATRIRPTSHRSTWSSSKQGIGLHAVQVLAHLVTFSRSPPNSSPLLVTCTPPHH